MVPAVIGVVRALSAAKKASRATSVAEAGAVSARDSARGITNAVSRFKTSREGQTLQSTLRNANNLSSANDEKFDGGGRKAQRPRAQESFNDVQEQVTQRLGAFGKEMGMSFDQNDAELLVKEPPTKPGFPYIIFTIAVLKDISDALVLTGVGYVVNLIFSFCMALLLFIWNLSKLSGGWWKKRSH